MCVENSYSTSFSLFFLFLPVCFNSRRLEWCVCVIRSLFRISRKEYFLNEKKRDENEKKKKKNIYRDMDSGIYIYIKKKIAVKRFFEWGMRVGVTGWPLHCTRQCYLIQNYATTTSVQLLELFQFNSDVGFIYCAALFFLSSAVYGLVVRCIIAAAHEIIKPNRAATTRCSLPPCSCAHQPLSA